MRKLVRRNVVSGATQAEERAAAKTLTSGVSKRAKDLAKQTGKVAAPKGVGAKLFSSDGSKVDYARIGKVADRNAQLRKQQSFTQRAGESTEGYLSRTAKALYRRGKANPVFSKVEGAAGKLANSPGMKKVRGALGDAVKGLNSADFILPKESIDRAMDSIDKRMRPRGAGKAGRGA